MPLSTSGSLLGTELSGPIPDPIALTILTSGLGPAICTWIVSNSIILPGTMVAAGAAVTGLGAIHFTSDALAFGTALAASIPATDSPGPGLAKWTAFGGAIMDHMSSFGGVLPAAFVANPLGGAVTGAGTWTFSSLIMVPTMASDLGLTDPANIAIWLTISTLILTHIQANALALSLGFTSPPGGGPLVGASLLS